MAYWAEKIRYVLVLLVPIRDRNFSARGAVHDRGAGIHAAVGPQLSRAAACLQEERSIFFGL